MNKKKGSDSQVGYGKPPKGSQFKPGQSGNPGGRKKGSLDYKTMVERIADTEIEISENGTKRRVPVVEALFRVQVREGLKGNIRASDSLLNRFERLMSDGDVHYELPEEDRELLNCALNQPAAVRPAPNRRARGGGGR
ncbi:hypothetical protein FHS85_004966 [Rhodoligotrophos appendicifer]|uniref:DUF5681 domain-containing protein n=1 Tax=Rhodoligotrophos appendicifer TaxID=987056 RepID=UPI0011850461|nr:DUF5681 domain-containing protein [Rhodoligotrophos appendicifer]